MTKRDLKYFKVAANLAELSTYHRTPIGCVIVYHNKIISTGFNKDRTDPLQKRYNMFRNLTDSDIEHKMHAETAAIKNVIGLDIDWSVVSLYTYRKRKDRPHGLARPCPSCMALIRDLGIKTIYYTTDQGYASELIE